MKSHENSVKVFMMLSLIIAVHGDRSWFSIKEPPLRWSPPTRALKMTDVEEHWFSVPLDHFDSNNNISFNVRYLSSNKYASSENNSILIMVGGEWTIDQSFLGYGSMYEIAKETGSRMIYTEHRYYGISSPVLDLTTPNLKYLTVDQSLADLAHFIKSIKSKNSKSKIVLFGGSYAGNMVVWFSQKYPDLVDGSVASSGPVLALRDFWGYMQVVHNTITEEGGTECVAMLTEAIRELRQEMLTERGRKRIAAAYSLCEVLDPENELDIQYFYAIIVWGFGGLVQTARPGTVARECRKLTSNDMGATPFDKLAKYVAGEPSSFCRNRTFLIMLDAYGNTEVDNESRLWYYQTCTEFGYYQTSPNTESIFDGLLTVEFYEEVCKRVFNERFTSDVIEQAVNRTNNNHGGINPKVENVLSVYGLQDPWHALGVQQDLGPSSPTFLVPKASHCFDLYGSSYYDTEEMAYTKKKIAKIVKSWLKK